MDELSAASLTPRSPKLLAGFWIRLLSIGIDAILLVAFGFLISLSFKPFLFKLGESGVWIGLLITFLYSGILQSSFGEGQSLGKKLLRIQVVKTDGRYLNLPMSHLRTAVIALILCNGWIGIAVISVLPAANNTAFQLLYAALTLLALMGAVILTPLHPLKRGLHDLLAGSVVVYKGAFNAEKIQTLDNPTQRKRAYAIVSVIGVLFICFGLYLNRRFPDARLSLSQFTSVQRRIIQDTALKNVSVRMMVWAPWSGPSIKMAAVDGFLVKDAFDQPTAQQDEAQKAARAFLASFMGPKDFDAIVVTIRSGFNIGFSKKITRAQHWFSADGEPREGK